MFRSVLFGIGILLALVLTTPLNADEFYLFHSLGGYVNNEMSNIFDQGDALKGESQVDVNPPEEIFATYYYYVRARIVDYLGNPVTSWVEDGEWVPGLGHAELVPAASEYTVPIPNVSTAYTYRVELWYINDVQGGLPPQPEDYHMIDSGEFYWTN